MTWSAMPQHRGTILLVGGRVHLMDDAMPPSQALVIRDGRVLAAGTEAAMRALAGPGARTIDVQGATVMPGLVDTHPHVLHFAARLRAGWRIYLQDGKDRAERARELLRQIPATKER